MGATSASGSSRRSSDDSLILQLVDSFFLCFGCIFPFLDRDEMVKDVKENQADAILLDSMCALSARLSYSPRSSKASRPLRRRSAAVSPGSQASHGEAFARRAKSGVAAAFSCPSITVVQSCLLLAYAEFGSGCESELWMYAGIAIRMAQDLGLHKASDAQKDARNREVVESSEQDWAASRKASDENRRDTFWAVFFLDRVISSSTGRPVSLRDKDIQVPLPPLDGTNPSTARPLPFPPLIRIIHLYGRITDVLFDDGTFSPSTDLTRLETELTDLYHGLPVALHFNAVSFQEHSETHQGPSFVLLHLWFHALVVLLHQPDLLQNSKSHVDQLFSNSRDLSMSSAKSIADILAFAEVMDARSFTSTPFTGQPVYIAACAFLNEGEAQTPAGSASASFARADVDRPSQPGPAEAGSRTAKPLAVAAHRNYRRCFQALNLLSLEWAGTRHLTVALTERAQAMASHGLSSADPNACNISPKESQQRAGRAQEDRTDAGGQRAFQHEMHMQSRGAIETTSGPLTSCIADSGRGRSLILTSTHSYKHSFLQERYLTCTAIGRSYTGTSEQSRSNVTSLGRSNDVGVASVETGLATIDQTRSATPRLHAPRTTQSAVTPASFLPMSPASSSSFRPTRERATRYAYPSNSLATSGGLTPVLSSSLAGAPGAGALHYLSQGDWLEHASEEFCIPSPVFATQELFTGQQGPLQAENHVVARPDDVEAAMLPWLEHLPLPQAALGIYETSSGLSGAYATGTGSSAAATSWPEPTTLQEGALGTPPGTLSGAPP